MIEKLLKRLAGTDGYRWGMGPRTRVPEVAALTMVYQSPAILRKWVEHYGALFGRENLFVISHGPCTDHAGIVAGCNYMVVPRDFSEEVARLKAIVLTRTSTALLGVYEGVVVGDVDELIVLDPGAGPSLRDYVLGLKETAVVAPLGFHIVPEDGYYAGAERAAIGAPLLAQVNRLVFDAEFCKPSVLRRPVAFSLGQHGLIDDRFEVDADLVLFHLKFLALNEIEAYEALAEEVAAELGPDKPMRQELWSKGFEGLRERAAWYANEGPGLPVREPRAAADGMYAMRRPGWRRLLRPRGHTVHALEVGDARPFAVPERWRALV